MESENMVRYIFLSENLELTLWYEFWQIFIYSRSMKNLIWLRYSFYISSRHATRMVVYVYSNARTSLTWHTQSRNIREGSTDYVRGIAYKRAGIKRRWYESITRISRVHRVFREESMYVSISIVMRWHTKTKSFQLLSKLSVSFASYFL